MLAPKADGKDPILYFYEDFLATFDPKARERHGVYYTPLEVVRFMVGALDRALREHLGAEGLADETVHILDPAAGTGTFLLGIADRLRRTSAAQPAKDRRFSTCAASPSGCTVSSFSSVPTPWRTIACIMRWPAGGGRAPGARHCSGWAST